VTIPVTGEQAGVAAVETLQANPDTTSVTVDHTSKLLSNDPYFGIQWPLREMDASLTWDVSTGSGIVVAVVDTGVQPDHPDLVDNLLPGVDLSTSPAAMSDTHGHGTHVAGIVAATRGNNIGVAGFAPDARVLPVKVFEPNGTAYNSIVAAGIVYAADHNADVINLSVGSTYNDPVMHDAVIYAKGLGANVVAGGGNSRTSGSPLNYPAAYPESFAVAATGENGASAPYSNIGNYIDISAPGTGVQSTYKNSGYLEMSGTSMATPYVSASIALLLQENPTWTAVQAETALIDTAKDLGAPGWDTTFGAGRVRPYKVLTGLNSPPIIVGTNPSFGPTAGGQTFFVIGYNMSSVTSIKVGGVTATNFTVVDDYIVRAKTPQGTPGFPIIEVSSPDGSDSISDTYQYGTTPTVSHLSPARGSSVGGNTVTIWGTGFDRITSVKLDGTSISYNRRSSNEISFVAPARNGNNHYFNVQVDTDYGWVPKFNAYTYVDTPVVNSVSPNNGLSDGGTAVTVSGAGFTETTQVLFDNVSADFLVSSDNTIEVIIPPHNPGLVDVTVVGPVEEDTLTDAFEYRPTTAPTPTVTITPTPTVTPTVTPTPTPVPPVTPTPTPTPVTPKPTPTPVTPVTPKPTPTPVTPVTPKPTPVKPTPQPTVPALKPLPGVVTGLSASPKGKKLFVKWRLTTNATQYSIRISKRDKVTKFEPWALTAKRVKTFPVKHGKYRIQIFAVNARGKGTISVNTTIVKKG